MALIACKECGNKVSEQALKCPKCGVQLRKPKRGFFGKLFKWSFILFNILMFVWLVRLFSDLGEVMEGASNEFEETGAALGV